MNKEEILRVDSGYTLFKGHRDRSGSFYIKFESKTSCSFPTGTKNYIIKLNSEDFVKSAKILLT